MEIGFFGSFLDFLFPMLANFKPVFLALFSDFFQSHFLLLLPHFILSFLDGRFRLFGAYFSTKANLFVPLLNLFPCTFQLISDSTILSKKPDLSKMSKEENIRWLFLIFGKKTWKFKECCSWENGADVSWEYSTSSLTDDTCLLFAILGNLR